MDIKELLETAKTDTRERFKQKLSALVRDSYKYRNLGAENQKLIMDTVYKHIDSIREGRGIPASTIKNDTYKLYSNREKLGLSEEDYEDIKEILNLFKR